MRGLPQAIRSVHQIINDRCPANYILRRVRQQHFLLFICLEHPSYPELIIEGSIHSKWQFGKWVSNISSCR